MNTRFFIDCNSKIQCTNNVQCRIIVIKDQEYIEMLCWDKNENTYEILDTYVAYKNLEDLKKAAYMLE